MGAFEVLSPQEQEEWEREREQELASLVESRRKEKRMTVLSHSTALLEAVKKEVEEGKDD